MARWGNVPLLSHLNRRLKIEKVVKIVPFIGKHSEETKAKMREAQSGSRNPMFGKHRYGINAPHFGKHHSEETKAKLSEANKGSNNPMFGKSGEKSPSWKGDKVATKDAGRIRARKLYECPKGMERHHIDGNSLNNSPENMMFLTRKEHEMLDGRFEKLKLTQRGNDGRFLAVLPRQKHRR